MHTASVCTKQIKYQSLLYYSRAGVLYELLSRSVLHPIPNNVKLMHCKPILDWAPNISIFLHTKFNINI
ncbi:unnamed protein product [Porites evermanni]|uniref:Uncharacterized protein n=1 Tax=Porites evermanni TaxID=104178 RepID=A0ABN8QY14_9CNID|nr:unnamed protein product [Porites evermanni]